MTKVGNERSLTELCANMVVHLVVDQKEIVTLYKHFGEFLGNALGVTEKLEILNLIKVLFSKKRFE